MPAFCFGDLLSLSFKVMPYLNILDMIVQNKGPESVSLPAMLKHKRFMGLLCCGWRDGQSYLPG